MNDHTRPCTLLMCIPIWESPATLADLKNLKLQKVQWRMVEWRVRHEHFWWSTVAILKLCVMFDSRLWLHILGSCRAKETSGRHSSQTVRIRRFMLWYLKYSAPALTISSNIQYLTESIRTRVELCRQVKFCVITDHEHENQVLLGWCGSKNRHQKDISAWSNVC